MKLIPIPSPQNWQRLLPHQIAMTFPDVDAETFQDLLVSIKAAWQENHPIVLFEDKILDGRNRFRTVGQLNQNAAAGAHVVPTFQEFAGTYDDAIAFSIRENLARRHLTAGQRALIGDALATISHGGDRRSEQAKTEREANLPLDIDAVSKSVHVAPRTLRYARELRQFSPAAAERVKAGTESLHGALKRAKAAVAKPVPPVPPKPVNVDEAGHPIHAKARAVLVEGRARFKAMINQVRALKRETAKLTEEALGRCLHRPSTDTDYENIVRALKFAAPYSSCPLGDPCDDGCQLCHGTQWISESEYKTVPPELLKVRYGKP